MKGRLLDKMVCESVFDVGVMGGRGVFGVDGCEFEGVLVAYF